MSFEDLMKKMNELGITKGAVERRCGFYSGKITELSKGRMIVSAEIIAKIADALQEISEELSLLSDEIRALNPDTIGQFCVYEFSFPNGKLYYGSTISPDIRWKEGKGYVTQKVGEAIEEFGWENVNKRIIAENLTKQNASLVERALIRGTNSDMPAFGYNMC